jgi:hypothetical protein
MELLELQKKLISAARATATDERVPYAFEKRVMASLGASSRFSDAWAVWSRALWQSAVACVAITLLCGAWSFWSDHHRAAPSYPDEFESAVFASASTDEAW